MKNELHLQSYPTPPEASRIEWMTPGFVKLHPGPPIHYFLDCGDEHFHDHPFDFETHVILGGYREEVLVRQSDGTWKVCVFERKPGTSHQIPNNYPHKLIGLLDGPCITRCEYGPTIQEFSFVRLDENGHAFSRLPDEQEWKPYQRQLR